MTTIATAEDVLQVAAGDIVAGKYRVERVLGQGAMGIVVAARHEDLGQKVAIKLLHPTVSASDDGRERFLREARAAAKLESDHVARVFDVGTFGNKNAYMVMEHLDGNDLKAIVRNQGALPIADAVTYVLQACDAIAEAHALGIVHRDLKPANLFLIRRPNGSGSIKVLDFGISKQTGVEEVELTSTGAVLGSPMYMSPEQIAKSKSVDARTDIWAMGVVLYELLTGQGPFRAPSVLELAAQVLQEEPAPPRVLRPEISDALENIIVRCLRKKPEQRFQSINELVAALRAAPLEAPKRATGGTQVLVRPTGPSYSELLPLVPPAAAPVVTPSAVVSSTAILPPLPERAPAVRRHSTEIMPVFPSEPPIAPLPASSILPSPVIAPAPAVQESTGQTWGGTHNIGAPRKQSKGMVIVAAVVGLVIVGGTASWLALGRAGDSAPAASSAGSDVAPSTRAPATSAIPAVPAPAASSSTASAPVQSSSADGIPKLPATNKPIPTKKRPGVD